MTTDYMAEKRLVNGTAIRDQAKAVSMPTTPTVAVVAEVPNNSSPAEVHETNNPESRSVTSMSFGSVETTIIELISTTATTSAFPEPFGLSISPSGRWILAYSSSALYILAAHRLPEYRNSCRAFKLRRKPLAAAITDGGKLAILTTPHKIDIYQCGMGDGPPLTGVSQTLETVYLDNEARTIAFTGQGDVIAAGADGCIEIRNLGVGSLATDKRQITCGSLDTIAFSGDGRSLLITAAARRTRNSTFISVNGAFEDALFDDEALEQQPLGKMWITQLLFPERVHAKQAVFLPDACTGQITELLAFDSEKDRYRLYDINSKRFLNRSLGTPENFRWSRSERLEDSLPAISSDGSHIAVAVRLKDNSEIWLYHVPQNWRDMDSINDSETDLGEALSTLTPKLRLRLPSRGDNQPPERLVCLRWLSSGIAMPSRDRLFALVSTVTLSMPEDIVPSEAPAASGKVFVFDLIRSNDRLPESTPKNVTIDLDSILPIEDLAEEEMGLEQEVDLVRRRTTRIQRGRDTSGLPSPRSGRRSLSSGSNSGIVTLRDLADSGATRPRRRRSFSSISSVGEETDVGPLVLDEPYVQSQPRSQFSLHRAATVAANSPANRAHLRALPDRPLEYRRADGLREMPHESDADDWVPPPPPYSERPDPSGPSVSIPNTSMPAAQVILPQATQHRSQRMTSDQDPLQPRLFQPSTVTPQMSQIRPPGLPMSLNTTTPNPQPQVVSRRAVPTTRSQSDNNISQRPQADPLPNITTIPRNLPPLTAPHQPLPPPRPGALQTSFTLPATAHSPRPIPRNLLGAQPLHSMQQRSVSSPASPVVTSMAGLRGGVNATDFVLAVGLPTPEQMQTFHRRSSSGAPVPRAAMGAVGSDGRVSSGELNRPLRPSTSDNRDTVRHTNDSSSRPSMREQQDRRRPALTHLATIASAVSRNGGDDPVEETLVQPTALPQSEPTTPTGRRSRWRMGPSGRTSQLANIETYERDRQTAPVDDQSQSSKTAPKRRGFRCIVM